MTNAAELRDATTVYLPWLLSGLTIGHMVMTGNKHRSSWLFGLLNQLLWLVWICASSSWGLLPMNGALAIVYWRNHRKWREPEPHGRRLSSAELERDLRAARSGKPLGYRFGVAWSWFCHLIVPACAALVLLYLWLRGEL